MMPTGNLEEMTKGWMIAISSLLITFFVTVSKKKKWTARVFVFVFKGDFEPKLATLVNQPHRFKLELNMTIGAEILPLYMPTNVDRFFL